jgi:hypothetical protein
MADIATINAALDDNSDWFEAASVTKCGAWITAATQLLHRAEESKRGGQGTMASLRINIEQLREELKSAKLWYSKNSATANSRRGNRRIVDVDFTYTDGRR